MLVIVERSGLVPTLNQRRDPTYERNSFSRDGSTVVVSCMESTGLPERNGVKLVVAEIVLRPACWMRLSEKASCDICALRVLAVCRHWNRKPKSCY